MTRVGMLPLHLSYTEERRRPSPERSQWQELVQSQMGEGGNEKENEKRERMMPSEAMRQDEMTTRRDTMSFKCPCEIEGESEATRRCLFSRNQEGLNTEETSSYLDKWLRAACIRGAGEHLVKGLSMAVHGDERRASEGKERERESVCLHPYHDDDSDSNATCAASDNDNEGHAPPAPELELPTPYRDDSKDDGSGSRGSRQAGGQCSSSKSYPLPTTTLATLMTMIVTSAMTVTMTTVTITVT
ncbi:hypothetical protein EDB85DRAFT_1899853 [Lactarius pseudohatsudake]|nr:hypothetical protein EDB85DRAFT_1899853 [Lactarius pseudohatsudake]